jgi:hypothetical protein
VGKGLREWLRSRGVVLLLAAPDGFIWWELGGKVMIWTFWHSTNLWCGTSVFSSSSG